MKRSAYWFLGEYCCQLTGTPTAASSTQNVEHSPSPKKPSSSGNDLLDVWASSTPVNSRPADLGAKSVAGLGVEAGSRVVAHPVVAAMNGATMSILLRLKHAAMFEDFQVFVWTEQLMGGIWREMMPLGVGEVVDGL